MSKQTSKFYSIPNSRQRDCLIQDQNPLRTTTLGDNYQVSPRMGRSRISKVDHHERERRIRKHSDISLSPSDNATALLSASEMKGFNQQTEAYQSIAEITQQQNENLKEQNLYLLEKLKAMKQKESKFKKAMEKALYYKSLYHESMEQLEMVKQKCEVYKQKSEQMKSITMTDLYKLQEKLVPMSKTNDDSYSNESFTFSSPTLRGEELLNAIPGCSAKSD